MRLELYIDNMRYEIDSTDPVILGKWIVEIISRFEWTPATYSKFQVWPSFVSDGHGDYRADWIADSRVLGRAYVFSTPQELLDALQEQINDLEALRAKDAKK